MKILITNDDGVNAKGLLPLIRWAKEKGEVVTVAPKSEQSAKSHGIQIHHPFHVSRVELAPGIEAYAVDSTPADCVRFAVLGLGQHYDLVISGVNRGFNIGTDIMYSGTVAAVFEAAALGLPALAISTEPEYYDSDFDGVLERAEEIFHFIHRNQLLAKNGIYNINIPTRGCGIRITRQGGPYYSDDFHPQEGDYFKPTGKCVYSDSGNPDLDTDTVMHGVMSVMPLTIDRTNLDVFRELSHLNP